MRNILGLMTGIFCLLAWSTSYGQLPHSGAAHMSEGAQSNYIAGNEMSDRIDNAVNNHLDIDMLDDNVTLSDSQQWATAFFELTGANSAIRELILNGDEKRLTVWNNTTGGFDVTVKYAAGNTVNVAPGLAVLLHGDGTDIVNAGHPNVQSFASVTPDGLVDWCLFYDGASDQMGRALCGDMPGASGGGGATGGPVWRLLHIIDEKTLGTDGGDLTGATWNVRTLNTSKVSEIAGASLSTNQVTLPAGTYWLNGQAPGFDVGQHKLRWRTTGGSTTCVGSNAFARQASGGDSTDAKIICRFTITGSTIYELQHWAEVTQATNGAGLATDEVEVEVYADIRIWRIDDTSFRDFENVLVNGDFQVAQRGTTFTAASSPDNSDDTYGLDRWIHLTEAADSTDFSQETTVVPGAPNATTALKSDTQTANNKFGWLQVLPSDRSQRLIGSNASLSFKARSTTGAVVVAVRAAILCWDSTADAVTSDVVDAWGAPATNPTFVANWTLEGDAPVDLAVTLDAYATVTVENVAIDTASCANVAAFIWVDEDTSVNDLLYITDVQLEPTPFASGYDRRSFEDELNAAERFFLKSFAYATAPAQNAGTVGAISYRTDRAGAVADGVQVQFGRSMFKSPAITFYNPSAANALWRRVTAAADSGAASAIFTSEKGFFAENAQDGSAAAADDMAIQWAAEGEL